MCVWACWHVKIHLTMRRIYFDHNATTPVHPLVRDAMLPYLGELWGNPSSAHWAGRLVANSVEDARKQVAALINAKPSEVHFNAGGSEGDNFSLRGVLMLHGAGAHVITTTVEHPAVYSTAKLFQSMGAEVTFVEVDRRGLVDPDDIKRAIKPNTRLISVMLANNETGVVEPISEIAAIARERGVAMHTDAVQAVGKIPLDVQAIGVDLLSASGHKLNAPKGVGFQYVREGFKIAPMITGGHQECGMRAGTEGVPNIVAMGKACQLAMEELPQRESSIGALRARLEEGILSEIPSAVINGAGAPRLYNTLNISFPGVEGEALLMVLDQAGIAVSTGSACSSGSMEPSRVLTSMGLEPLISRGALRISLGYGNTVDEVDYCLSVLVPAARRFLSMSPFSK